MARGLIVIVPGANPHTVTRDIRIVMPLVPTVSQCAVPEAR